MTEASDLHGLSDYESLFHAYKLMPKEGVRLVTDTATIGSA